MSPETASDKPLGPREQRAPLWILGAALGLLGLALATFWLLRLPAAPLRTDLKKRLKTIAEITSLSPSVESRFSQAPEFVVVQSERLVSGETVQTDGGGRAEIVLDSGESFELVENSRLILESDTASGKTRVSLLAGGIDLKSTIGPSVEFLRDGRVVGVADLLAPHANAKIAAEKFNSGVVVPTKAATGEEGNAALKAADAPPADSDLSTLSQDEILRALQGQGPVFRKCYLNLLQETRNKVSKVSVLVAFEIQPNGKLNDVRVWHSNVQSRIFLQCLSESFERAHFRAFQGDPIRVDEFPLTFE